MKKIIYLIMVSFSITINSQIKLLKDFASNVDGMANVEKQNVAIVQDFVYFTAYSGFNEVWRTDGNRTEPVFRTSSNNSRFRTSNPKWVVTTNGANSQLNFVAIRGSITPTVSGTSLAYGTNNDNPFSVSTTTDGTEGVITSINNDVYFVNNNSIHKFDGTTVTALTTELNGNGFTDFRAVFAFNDKIYFNAINDASIGRELYEFNPNTQTSRLVADIAVGSNASNPDNFFIANNKLYFTAKTGNSSAPFSLFVYNSNTDSVSQITNTESPEDLTVFNVSGNTFIMLSADISGVRRLVRVLTTSDSPFIMSTNISDIEDIIVFNNELYFGAIGTNGKELYKSSQIPNSEVLVSNINSSGDSNPRNFLEHNGELFFRADDGTNGQELWKVDTNGNVTMLENFATGSNSFSPIPFASINNKLIINGVLESTGKRELFVYTNTTTFTGIISSDWNDTNNWDNGIPDDTKSAIIPSAKIAQIGNYTNSIFNTTANVLDIEIEGQLIIDAGSSLTVHAVINQINGGTVKVSSEYSTNSSLNKSGSLILKGIQSGDDVTYERSVRGESSGNNHNWSLISFGLRDIDVSSVIATNNFAVSTTNANQIALGFYNQPGSGWLYYLNSSPVNIVDARGYSYSSGVTALSYKFTYSGKLRFQDETYSLITGNTNDWNLIGNPFLAYLPINATANSANNLILENNSALKVGFKAFYIWDSTMNSGNGGYKIINQSTPLNESFLAPGQGFFVNASGNTNFNFPINLTSHQQDVNFSKQTNQPKVTLILNQNNEVSSTEVKYLSNTSVTFESGFDANKFDGEAEDVSIYTEIPNNSQGLRLGLQCVSQDYENISIPIGTKVAANQEIIITATANDLPTGVMVYLEDKILNTFTRLDNGGEYKYIPISAIDNSGRFYLRTSSQTLSTEDDNELETINIYQQDRRLQIVGLVGIEDATIKMYNLLGQEVLKRYIDGKNTTESIPLPTSVKTGVYIVNVESRTAKISKKIILN